MADTLSKYVTPEELQASFDVKAASRPARAKRSGKMSAAKAKDIVASLPYLGASFIPSGKEEMVGMTMKKLAKKHELDLSKVEALKKEWEAAYAASLPTEEESL